MTELKRRTGSRKAAKAKGVSGQRSLLDLFPPKAPSIKLVSSAANAETQETNRDAETSSDVELIDPPEVSSSPFSTDVDSVTSDGTLEASQGSQGSSQTSTRQHDSKSSKTRLFKRSSQLNSAIPSIWLTDEKLAVEGISRDLPIIIDSSPSKPSKATRALPKRVYPIFAPRNNAAPPAAVLPKRTSRKIVAVPYPDRDAQHVRGPQSQFSAPALPPDCLPTNAHRKPFVSPVSPPTSFLSCAYGPDLSHVKPPLPNSDISSSATLSEISSPPTASLLPTEAESIPSDSIQIPTSCDPSTSQRYLEDIPASHRTHPAISRLLAKLQSQPQDHLDSTPPSQELWTDKYHPRRADETLGNEDHALYLRAWLLALKLHIETAPSEGALHNLEDRKRGIKTNPKPKEFRGTKRPQILRQVDKRKKRRRLDSEEPEDFWITDDESDDHPAEYESEDEIAFCQRTLSRLQRAPEEARGDASCDPTESSNDAEADAVPGFSYSTPQFGNQIHNTILLNGPSGCGKTAAVYACAEELGWDVFEVYPGIGERSGAALNKLIGEVGKNHLVKQTQRQQKAQALFFGEGRATDSSARANGSREQHRGSQRRLKRVDSEELSVGDNMEDLAPPDNNAEFSTQTAPVSQSIVLIEEVDVLYESDANFWPSLINIIKDCKRPVVMTCNDISLVPIKDLPLQVTLTFTPCAVPLATSYLQCLSAVEQRPLERSVLSRLYENPDEASPESGLSIAAPLIARVPDLRRAIHQLQSGVLPNQSTGLQLGDISQGETTGGIMDDWLWSRPNSHATGISQTMQREDLKTLQRMVHYQENLSFVDCYLRRRWVDVLTESMTADSVADQQLGYTVLPCDPPTSESAVPVNQPFYHQDELIAREALCDCLNRSGCMCSVHMDLQGCASAAREYAAQMVASLGELQVPADVLISRSSIFLDYDPWVRYMVGLDDANEAAFLESQVMKEGTRKTRNSQKSIQAVRYVSISDAYRRTLTHSALRIP